ncbi:hypothetical protein PR048_011124 [Dryococelus australis]|uniref:Uncharacterized protein n=1 Tax=Dryococelus australis TaxID=614101 RepID=A0ABQ9HKQ8_9NEOP|nr:hypothetical protein PR048_011124 [Dryococelus australis]
MGMDQATMVMSTSGLFWSYSARDACSCYRDQPSIAAYGSWTENMLNRVYPDLAEAMKQKQEGNRVPVAPRRFSPQDLVYAKNMG